MKFGRKFLASVSFLGWKKRANINFERSCQNDQFGIGYAAQLRFDFRERSAAQIPALNRTTRGKHFLREFLLITQLSDLRADYVLRFCHAPKTELDTKTASELNCTDFGAT